ncbi:WD repeat and FYVE domain-containing protein 2 [Geodia barretti]|uniref:WD repeat and FYVE domain-containing protein 2 n=1 Tax=Geodia barretti TaxID=519541 RepID=A0AA35W4Q2_GEOBA|nr:WD repeat and FYVE domain-containing protein 2 [Geodia barretti]
MDIAYDHISSYVFVADYGGQISVLKLESQGFQFITTLKGHQSSVRSLAYDQESRVLFSGGYDQIIVVWDIGSQKGTAYELTGHKAKLTDLCFSPQVKRLLSSSERGNVGIWDLDIQREETAEWGGGSTCEKCGIPFFWNVKDMWTRKVIGVRQHHCRKCGRAVCAKCSELESTYPPMGFEIPVRMCQDCHATVTTDE